MTPAFRQISRTLAFFISVASVSIFSLIASRSNALDALLVACSFLHRSGKW